MDLDADIRSKISDTIPKQKSCESGNGFTFLEMLVVLTLVILILGQSFHSFLHFFQACEKEFKHINNVLKTLRNDAVLKSASYCLLFDLKLQRMMTSKEFDSGECSNEFFEKPNSLKPREFF